MVKFVTGKPTTEPSAGSCAFLHSVSCNFYIPPGSKIVGEALASVILSSGAAFNSLDAPKAVVKVAQPGEQGRVEISDLIVSTQGQQRVLFLSNTILRPTTLSQPVFGMSTHVLEALQAQTCKSLSA